MRSRFGSMPEAQCTSNERHASPMSRIDSSTACAITGLYTLSSKLPWLPANPTVASLPNTRVATIVSASHCVGFTLPGMIEEPGSFSGMVISPMPFRGPEASQRTSLAIFISAIASTRSDPLTATSASWAASAANVLSACRNGWPVNSEILAAASRPNSGCALRPVPTAVPPMASSYSPSSLCRTCASEKSSCATQPEISWPRVIGVASWRWVRPTLTMSPNASALPARV